MREFNCKICNKKFSSLNGRERVVCSPSCRSVLVRTGKKHSEETKKILSEKRSKRICTKETREKMSKLRKGKPLSLRNRIGISRALKGKKHKPNQGFQKGSKNPNWNGGVSPELVLLRKSQDNRIWREAVYARDDYICKVCGDSNGGNLNAHHIENFIDSPDLRFAVSNGITLCEKCHIRFHKKYGYKKNNSKQIYEFLSEQNE